MILNPKGSLKTNLAKFDNKELNNLPLAYMKYTRWDKAYEEVPDIVKPILSAMFDLMEDDSDMNWLVDYKVRDLKAGDCGCPLEGWHTDCVANPWHPSKFETHLIFSTHYGTEFILDELEVKLEEDHFNRVLNRYGSDYWFTQVKPNTITQYTRYNLHRAPIINKDCRRMVLRLTQIELIK